MTQTGIPYVFMRGGTSRGPYFNRKDLPEDRETLAEVLLAASLRAAAPGLRARLMALLPDFPGKDRLPPWTARN